MTQSLSIRIFAVATAFWLLAAPALCAASCTMPIGAAAETAEVMPGCHGEMAGEHQAPIPSVPAEAPTSTACCTDDGQPLVQTQEPEFPDHEPVIAQPLPVETLSDVQQMLAAPNAAQLWRPTSPYHEINRPLLT